MAEAIKYALGHWDELNVFLADGAVAIDNNVRTRNETRCTQSKEQSLCGQRSRRPNRCHPGQPHLKLPPPRCRPAALSHPTAGQLAVAADKRPAGLAARQMEGRTKCETDRLCPKTRVCPIIKSLGTGVPLNVIKITLGHRSRSTGRNHLIAVSSSMLRGRAHPLYTRRRLTDLD